MMANKLKKIAVLTSGGDAPGMNACIRSVVRTAYKKNIYVCDLICLINRHSIYYLLYHFKDSFDDYNKKTKPQTNPYSYRGNSFNHLGMANV